MYIPKQYPKWLYNASLPACIVDTVEEHEALGDEWATHPDLVKPPAAEAVEALSETKTPTRKRK